MAQFLKNLRRGGSDAETAELQQLATRLETQHHNLGQLVQHADRSIAQLQRLATLGERVAGLERQLARMDTLTERFTQAEQEVSRLTGLAESFETRLAASDAGVERTRGEVASLMETLNSAVRLKESVGEVTALDGPFRQLQAEMEGLRSQVESFKGNFARLREQHETTVAGYRTAGHRIESFDADWQRLSRTLEESGHRIAGLEQLMGDMAPVTESVSQTRRELASAKAIADQLAQKVALLEQQREAIDRATGKLEQLAALSIRADAGLERHADLVRSVTDLRSQMHTMEGVQHALLDRSTELTERLGQIDSGHGSAERALADLRTSLDQSVERLALENRNVAGVTQQVTELRRTLADTEHRLDGLASDAAALNQTAARADSLTAQVAELSTSLSSMTEIASRARGATAEMEQLELAIEGLAQRSLRLDESRPLLDRTVRDLAALGATGEAIADALEQLRTARDELRGTQGTLEGTRAWVGDTVRSVSALKEDVAGLDRMRSTVDALRQELDLVAAQSISIESRRSLVDDVQRRLAEAAALGSTIEERARGVADRLGGMEDQLGTIVPRLEEVGRAGSQLVGLQADLRDMEQRLTEAQASVGSVEERARGVETLNERMRELGREVEQRANAVQRASDHLARATTLRQEAATAAETLAERGRELEGSLTRAGERLGELDTLSRELDSRILALSGVQERLGAFEARLAEWRSAEHQVAQALEQAEARQAAITSLQAEIRGLYAMAERTQADARVIVEAQPEVSQTRAELDTLLSRMNDGEGLLATLADRRRQLGRAEERLSQADTLLADVRGALEVLLAQKAQVDFFLEQASALGVEAKHAEATLQALRDERRLSDRIRGSLADLQRRDEAAEPERVARR